MFQRITTILVLTFVAASALLGFQTSIEHTVGGFGFLTLSTVVMSPLVIAAYNNCKSALRRQQLPASYTSTRIGR